MALAQCDAKTSWNGECYRNSWKQHCSLTSLCIGAEAEGAAALTLHARTADQQYAPPVHWAAVGELVANVSIPVIGNGDIYEAGDALRMMRETGCKGASASCRRPCTSIVCCRAACLETTLHHQVTQETSVAIAMN